MSPDAYPIARYTLPFCRVSTVRDVVCLLYGKLEQAGGRSVLLNEREKYCGVFVVLFRQVLNHNRAAVGTEVEHSQSTFDVNIFCLVVYCLPLSRPCPVQLRT